MSITTANGKQVEPTTPPTEWVALTEDPVTEVPLVICDDGESFYTVRMDPTLGPVEVEDAGVDLHITPCFDRARVDALLADEFSTDLDADDRTTLLDWYETFVRELVEDDIYDPDFQTTFIGGIAFIEGMDVAGLADEVEAELGVYDRDLTRAIAATVDDWWADEDAEVPASPAFAARVELTG